MSVSDTGRTISILHGGPSGNGGGGDGPPGVGGAGGAGARPWIGVRFVCAGAYLRVARNKEGTGYQAMCPRCGKRIRFRVGPGGTDQRFFEVSC